MSIESEEKSKELSQRVAEFKKDSSSLYQVQEFVESIIHDATIETARRLNYPNPYLDVYGIPAEIGFRRQLHRARGFVVRMFDALCNCTQTAAAAARTSARNPFTKR